VARIELDRISKRFAGTTVLKQVSLSIEEGEFFVLVGPSGCGKSTLLNMIVGLEAVSEGEIRVDGKRVNDIDPRKRNMAMVFQSYAIYPHMTVRENMAFPLKLAGLDPDSIDARVREAAGILELEDCLDRKPHALSGGQRQRVAMGRAVVREPAVFLLDEPLSNLDAKLRVQMRTEIARLQRRLGTTTVYVTHDQTEALTLGDRIAVLRRGEVLQVGTPRELYEHPASLFVAGFVGSPAMNFLPGRWTAGRLELPGGSLTLTGGGGGPVAVPEGAVVAGFRPEHLRLPGDTDPERAGLMLTAKVEFIEWLGADLFVHFGIALDGFEAVQLPDDLDIPAAAREGRELIARIDPAANPQEGDTLRLCLDPGRVLLFDPRSGANLLPAGCSGRPAESERRS